MPKIQKMQVETKTCPEMKAMRIKVNPPASNRVLMRQVMMMLKRIDRSRGVGETSIDDVAV